MPKPEVCAAAGLNDTLYGVPAEQVTLAVDVDVSVPVTTVIVPKFMLETVIAQDATTLIFVVKLNVVVAADAEWAAKGSAKHIPIPINLLISIRINRPV